jgi:outer membrane protein, heavy metal efflux system
MLNLCQQTLFVLFLIAFTIKPVFADEEQLGINIITEQPSLENYIRYAVENNPGLKAQHYRWQAEEKKIGYVGGLPEPVLSYSYFVENVETRVGPQEQKFGIKQTLPWFGTLGTKKDIARQNSKAVFQKYQSYKQSLIYKIKRAFYDYYLLGRRLAITRDNFQLLEFWESIIRTKYKVALSEHHDLINAQVELGKLEDQLISLENHIEPKADAIRALLNIPANFELPQPESIDLHESMLDADSVLSDVIASNPNLMAISNLIDKEKSKVDLAGKSSWPNLFFGVDYIQTGDAFDPSLNESGKDPWLVNVGITLPIWFGKNNAKKNEAKAQLLQTEYLEKNYQNELTAYTSEVLFEYHDALRKSKVYRDGLIPKSEQSLNVTFKAYQTGETDFLNVLNTQRQLLDLHLKFDQAVVTAAGKLAEIEMLTGTYQK